MYTTIKTLWERTKNKTEIARLTGHDWKTVAKVIKNLEKGIETPEHRTRETLKEKIYFIRIHTEPGEEAQVDFGYLGMTADDSGKAKKTWIFNMRLSYSRLDYYEKVYDQKVETFVRCHINAFEFFGGVPEYVKIDNLKGAILEASF